MATAGSLHVRPAETRLAAIMLRTFVLAHVLTVIGASITFAIILVAGGPFRLIDCWHRGENRLVLTFREDGLSPSRFPIGPAERRLGVRILVARSVVDGAVLVAVVGGVESAD